MPRGQKRPQTEILKEQLEKTVEKIAKYEEALKAAKAEKKQIEEDLKKTEFEDLIALMEEKGLSAEDIMALIEASVGN